MKKILYTLLFLSFFCAAFAQLPDDFYDELVSEGWSQPTGFLFDETGRTYLWEKNGRVWIVDEDGNKLPDPLIDISEEVMNWRDHGLLGFVLDPGYLVNGYFYLYYAVDHHYLMDFGTAEYSPDSTHILQPSIGRVTRYTADPSTNFTTTLPGSRHVLLGESKNTGILLLHESHGIGCLLFATDGTLLVSSGDGNTYEGLFDTGGPDNGSYTEQALAEGIMTPDLDVGSYRSQYLGSLNGKILRIDPLTGDGIPSNPFYKATDPRAAQSRVWAMGFRNLFRMALKPETGSHNPEDGNPGVIIAGDVGGSQWEELNIVTEGGQNFGWPLEEGYSGNWYYWNNPAPLNYLEVNPLFGSSNCDQEFLDFKQLFSRISADEVYFFGNPCNGNEDISAYTNTFVGRPPAVAWSNALWNPPARSVGLGFDGNTPVGIELTDPASTIEGEIFEGFSSITGAFYEGDSYPEKYRGRLFSVDFSGWIKTFVLDDNFKVIKVEHFREEADAKFLQLQFHPVDDCIYYIDYQQTPQLRKICYGGNPPPVAVIETDTIYGVSPLTVQFDASSSFDPAEQWIKSYHWDFGDGSESNNEVTTHTFTAANGAPTAFTVVLTVTDSLDLSASAEKVISLNNTPPQVEITSFNDGDFYPISGSTILPLIANVVDAEHSNDELIYEWQTFLNHNTHYHAEAIDNAQSTHVLVTPVGCAGELFWYTVELKVTDPAGLSTKVRQEIFPYCGPPLFDMNTISATAINKIVVIDWSLNDEDSIVGFEVQRLTDLTILDFVNAANQSSYTFVDEKPLVGLNTYRLKVLKENGLYDYSESVKVDFSYVGDFGVYPLPAADEFFIEYKSPETDKLRFELYNPIGVLMQSQEWTVPIGIKFRHSFKTDGMANGAYFYRFFDGETKISGSLLIQK